MADARIQFFKHDSEDARLEKLRKLASQLAEFNPSTTNTFVLPGVFTATENGLVPAPGTGDSRVLSSLGVWIAQSNGTVWRASTGAPADSLGTDGDFYLDVNNGNVYEKAGGTYTLQGNIQGPQGVAGATGPAGTNGADGADGVMASVVGTTNEIDVDSSDPANPVLSLATAVTTSLALADSAVQSVVAGTNVTVDNTDPQNPIVNASGGGGGMVLIGSDIAGSAVASLSVASIPSGYSSLLVVVNGRSDAAGQLIREMYARLNADTGANYDYEELHAFAATIAAGEGVGATAGFIGYVPGATATANRCGSTQFTIPNYLGTVFDKQATGHHGVSLAATTGNMGSGNFGFDWRPATPVAVTQVTVVLQGGNWEIGSGLWVYGLP